MEADAYDEDKGLLFTGTFCLNFVKGMFWSVLFILYRFFKCAYVQGGCGGCVGVCVCVCVRACMDLQKSPYYKHCTMIFTEEAENEGKHQIPGFQDGSTNPMMDSSLSNIVRSIA